MELFEKFNINKTVYENIVKRLKRVPDDFEMSLFSAMHSEHCGYMHSKKYLKDFYTEENNLENENAGCIRIKDYSVFFKMESHNHPCAIEPYQGAMTGVGGIIRDVLSLSARPIALSNSLKFGRIQSEKTKYYLSEVVRGISNYGNSAGIPTLCGETIFDERFEKIPIVNVFALGIVKTDEIKLSSAKENALIMLLGSKTGIDGLNGANFASNVLKDGNSSRQSVQIGDPYTKKRLIDAVIKINRLKTTIACQDLGASGILSSTSEMTFKGGVGAELYLEKVHVQFKDISPVEIMLSESQERMAFVIEKSGLEDFGKIANEFGLEFSIIGKTIPKREYKVFYNGKMFANIDLDVLCRPFLFNLEKTPEKSGKSLEVKSGASLDEQFIKMINDENFASKKYIFSQFDAEVQGRTSFSAKENSIGMQYLKETDSFIAFALKTSIEKDSSSALRNSFMNLYRKLVASGFEPRGITNCLNFSNPERKNVQNDFLCAVEELRRLSKGFKIPVVSGNVSFYNELNNLQIPAVSTLAMVGVLEDAKNLIPPNVCAGEEIFLLTSSNKALDFSDELKMKDLIFSLARKKVINSVKTAGKFGIVGALTKNALFYSTAFEIPKGAIPRDLYFKEYFSGYILISDKSCELKKYLEEFKNKENIPYFYLGKFGGDKIQFEGFLFEVEKLRKIYKNKIKSETES